MGCELDFVKVLVVLAIFPGSPVKPVAVGLGDCVQSLLGRALKILVPFALTNFTVVPRVS